MKNRLLNLLVLLTPMLLANLANAAPVEFCVYLNEKREIVKTDRLRQIPIKFRKAARCFTKEEIEKAKKTNALAAPKDIDLSGNIRRETISSPVGTIHLRWPRSVEVLFGRTPLRATVEAARATGRTIRQAGFPTRLKQINVEWNIVFMDENLPETQIPQRLISNCHPGWMTPPANIYIVAQRVVAGCSGKKGISKIVADARLAEVLVHEFAHAVEYVFLDQKYFPNRMRGEGFAAWFEQYAAKHTSILNETEIRKNTLLRAKAALNQSPSAFVFRGSGLDYARASMYFNVIVKRRGINGLSEIYKQMVEYNTPFSAAVKAKLNWDQKKFDEEVAKYILNN